MDNIILMTDSYKFSHWNQYPEGMTSQYSYFESRGGKYENVVFFGLQYLIKKYLTGCVVTIDELTEAAEFTHNHFGRSTVFNYNGWEYIVNHHNGRLPIEIKAVAEGSVISVKNVLFTVENTDPKCFWLTSYLETLLEQVWYPSTIATQSYYMKKTIQKYLDKTGDDKADFKLHDFGYRGSSSQESAAIGGAAHLLNFMGSDTVAGIRMLQKYYGATMPAFSIPAAEHSTITSWGKDHEVDAYRNMLEQNPIGLVAVVSDSYDIYNACKNLWGKELRDMVINRNGTLVVRPDSGDPTTVVSEVLEVLGEAFGFTTNKKGYKVLPSYIRVIQGDGIDEKSLEQILKFIEYKKWSADNIAFGSGGGLLQKANRDTMQFAYKCSCITVNGKDRFVYKHPITDSEKRSKSGKLSLIYEGPKWVTYENATPDVLEKSALKTVFKNGELLIDQSLEEVRGRVHEG